MKSQPLFFALIVVALTLASCRSTPYGRLAVGLNGMVYDFENKPIPQYIITLDGKNEVSTDINGRFFIPRVTSGTHVIGGGRQGYESYRGELVINDRRQVVYIRVPTLAQLINLADEALSANRLEEAADFLRRAWSLEEPTTELLFYSAILSFRRGDYEKAVEYLQQADYLGGGADEYVRRFLDELLSRYGPVTAGP
jgi:tetratricopeptide (TPR) repeat protein